MKIKGLLTNLLLVTLSLILTFGVLEIAARLTLHSETVRIDNVAQDAAATAPTDVKEIRWGRRLAGPALFKTTPSGLRLFPNVRVNIEYHALSEQDIEVRTNSLGYRGEEIPPKTDGEVRVLVLGDSITLADYAPEAQTIPGFIEQRLKERRVTNRNIRVINAGTSSIDLRSELMILMETGLSTKPDIVVEALYLNDADTSFTLSATTYPRAIRWSRLLTFAANRTRRLETLVQYHRREMDHKPALEKFVASHPVSPDADWRTNSGGFHREVAAAFGDWGYAWTDEAWRSMEETLELMQGVARDHDFELYVLLLPVRQQVQAKDLHDEPQQKFAQVMSRLGLPHLDLLPVLRETYARDREDVFYDHCHYRTAGNALIAEQVADLLARQSAKLRAGGRAPSSPEARVASSAVAPARLERPAGLTLMPSGEVLVADAARGTIERVDASGRLLGPLGSLTYRTPAGIVVDTLGFVNVADMSNQRIVRLAPDGSPVGTLTAPDGGFRDPLDVAAGPRGSVFVADTGHDRIVHYDQYGQILRTWGNHGTTNGEFQEPVALAASASELYVADFRNARIQVFSLEGGFLRSWKVRRWEGIEGNDRPGLVYANDRIYASDVEGNSVLVYTTQGDARPAITAPEIRRPARLAVSRDGGVLVGNLADGSIVTIDTGGTGSPVVRRLTPIS